MKSKIAYSQTRTRAKAIALLVSLVTLSMLTQAAPGSQQELAATSRPEWKTPSVLVRSDRPIGRHLFADWYVVKVPAASPGQALKVV
jgi:hypothetical protein